MQVDPYERVAKSVIVVCKKGPKGLTDEFHGYKMSRKPFGFGINSYLKDGAFKAVKRDAKFKTWYVKGVPFVHGRYTKGVPLS